jgi:hypothetical protein
MALVASYDRQVATYRRADGVLSEVIDGRAVVVEPSGSEVLTLNTVGTVVWEALVDVSDDAALVHRVHQRFPDVPAERVAADVGGFLAELTEAGIVVRGSP